MVFSAGVNTFVSNKADQCGAVGLWHSSAVIRTESSFVRNEANISGGALCVVNSSMQFSSGVNIFLGNKADRCGAINFV